ncbi:MAG: type II toxin-antitoxin system mRNA interferase toxin, RelE/StbE family [Chloroflexi bacterium]|nr:MAG: type II toxin-antitoxin system mRNA interferase toxin, RelE/StbE family [Chloroflexota bacterium]
MYRIVIVRSAQKELANLPDAVYDRVVAAIQSLATTPCPVGCVKLQGSEDWRIRVGAYRIIYRINDDELVVTVIKVGHRGSVYR